MHLFISAYAHPAWGLITFTQSRHSPLLPCETPLWHNAGKDKMLRSDCEALNRELAGICNGPTEFTESLKSAKRVSTFTRGSRLILLACLRWKHDVLTHAMRTMYDREDQKKTQSGKHSWLPLLLLTPAVGCDLHSNRTWKHCAELIFEVVIFNTPFLSLFYCSILWKCFSHCFSQLLPSMCISTIEHLPLLSSDVIIQFI